MEIQCPVAIAFCVFVCVCDAEDSGTVYNEEDTPTEVGGGAGEEGMDDATETAAEPESSAELDEETMLVNEAQANSGRAAFLPEAPSEQDDSFDSDSFYDFAQNGESANLEPDNPLLDRAQAALKLQLESKYQELSEELWEKGRGKTLFLFFKKKTMDITWR